MSAAPSGLAGFFHKMEAREEAPDRFRFATELSGRRLFGGITLGQAIVAAARTVTGMTPHELHSLFLRPHQPGANAEYVVERLRDGRRFASRRVTAVADGKALSESVVSFAAPAAGLAFQAAAPLVPPAGELPLFNSSGAAAPVGAAQRTGALFEHRLIRWQGPSAGSDNRLDLWARPLGDDPGTPVLRAAALAALSDLSSQLLGLQPDAPAREMAATLNHTLWLHSLPPLQGWLLFLRESSVATAGRVLMTGSIFDVHGNRCASLAQESLLAAD